MTKAQRKKTVAICEDVLASMKFLDIQKGFYLRAPIIKEADIGKSLQVLLPKMKPKSCTTCGLGAAFISYVRLFDKVKIDKDWFGEEPCLSDTSGRVVYQTLGDIFTYKNLDCIEEAFEGRGHYAYYLDQYPNPRHRLRAIMKNVIKNDGEFIPKLKELE